MSGYNSLKSYDESHDEQHFIEKKTIGIVEDASYTWIDNNTVKLSGYCEDYYIKNDGTIAFSCMYMAKKVAHSNKRTFNPCDEGYSETDCKEYTTYNIGRSNWDIRLKVDALTTGKAGIRIGGLDKDCENGNLPQITPDFVFFYKDHTGNVMLRVIREQIQSLADIPDDIMLTSSSGPVYLRAQHVGNFLFFYTSSDGQSYTFRKKIDWPGAQFVGPAYTAGDPLNNPMASFTDIVLNIYPRVCIKRGIDLIRYENIDTAVQKAHWNDQIFVAGGKYTISSFDRSDAEHVKVYIADYTKIIFDDTKSSGVWFGLPEYQAGLQPFHSTSKFIIGENVSFNKHVFIYDTKESGELDVTKHHCTGIFGDLCLASAVANDGQTVELGPGTYGGRVKSIAFIGVVGAQSEVKNKATRVSLGFLDNEKCNWGTSIVSDQKTVFKDLWFEVNNDYDAEIDDHGYWKLGGDGTIEFKDCTYENLTENRTVPSGADRSKPALVFGSKERDIIRNAPTIIDNCTFKNFNRAFVFDYTGSDHELSVSNCVFENNDEVSDVPTSTFKQWENNTVR